MKTAYLVAGLTYGDEGKGATVDYLVRRKQAGLVVRYNGGPQAAHNVVTADGRHHTFSQFGSGMFVPGVRTHLSRFMLVNPLSMMREDDHLHALGIRDAWKRTTIDERALIITPFQRALQRIQRRGKGTSCGHGLGQARADHIKYGDRVLFAGDLRNAEVLEEKLRFLQQVSLEEARNWASAEAFIDTEANVLVAPQAISYCRLSYEQWNGMVVAGSYLDELLEDQTTVVFEGAQGVLLDERWGEEGFNTWTNTTFENAYTLLKRATDYAPVKLGVVRAYATRHGAGPFPTEFTIDRRADFPEPHNDDFGYQGKFRRGKFNQQDVRKALSIVGGVDGLVVNHLDRQYLNLRKLESDLDTPVVLQGMGPTAEGRLDTGIGMSYNQRVVKS